MQLRGLNSPGSLYLSLKETAAVLLLYITVIHVINLLSSPLLLNEATNALYKWYLADRAQQRSEEQFLPKHWWKIQTEELCWRWWYPEVDLMDASHSEVTKRNATLLLYSWTGIHGIHSKACRSLILDSRPVRCGWREGEAEPRSTSSGAHTTSNSNLWPVMESCDSCWELSGF